MSQRVVKRRPVFTKKVISTLQQVSKKKSKGTTLMSADFLFRIEKHCFICIISAHANKQNHHLGCCYGLSDLLVTA